MIHRIITFSARNPALILLFTIFMAGAGWWAMRTLPLDALPDVGDTQVIVYTRWERSPDVVEDQVTFPLVSILRGSPRVRAVRGFSDFGFSFVYAIFEDGTDPYWARARTLEYLSGALAQLPEGVKPQLGPDASGLGWVYQYVLRDKTGQRNPAELRSVQDWYLRNHLRSVEGVAEVAAVGGFGRQYQVQLDPERLRRFSVPVSAVVEAVQGANAETGGRLIEMSGAELMIRGRGYLKSARDLEETLVASRADGTPIRIQDFGVVTMGPDLRRGVADLDGAGETVSGIIVMRQGQNALDVIGRVKAKLDQVKSGLPQGVEIVPIYDRSELIRESIHTLRDTMLQVMATVAVVILLFLMHLPSAAIPLVTIPIAVLIAFLPFRAAGMTANIMSLGGIALAIGALVDASIVVVEQAHKKLEDWDRGGRRGDPRSVVMRAIQEVGRPSFYALLVIAVSFIPVLALEAQEGRMFHPLAYSKTFAMVVAAVLAITLDPALRMLLMRPHRMGRIRPEDQHPLSRRLMRWYGPVAEWSLRRKWIVVGAALGILLATVPVAMRLGGEFLPPFDEGDVFYMPSTLPGISVAEVQGLLERTDRVLRTFPEVKHVLGKAGRADTATDPAPLSMLETVVTLKPKDQWRKREVWYTGWAPEWLKPALRTITPDHITREELVARMDEALKIPGLVNAWTSPVRARTDMLSTGMRTPLGLKVQGPDLVEIQKLASRVEEGLKQVPGTRSVFAERTGGGYFLDIEWDRTALARYGMSLADAQSVVQNAIGGETVTTTVEGRARYSVNVRLMRDARSDLESLRRVPVATSDGRRQVPLADLARVRISEGPSMIRNEDGLLTGYVYIDLADRDPAGYIADARKVLPAMPPGYTALWSGQYEAMERVSEKLRAIVPLTLALIVGLMYMSTRSITRTLIILFSVPFAAVGAIWLLYLLDYNLSVAVWVGMIALLGVDAETGVFMLLYLDQAYERARREGRLRDLTEMRMVILEGAVYRLRPKFMTVATTFLGLLPVLWATGTGADVMKRIAAPMAGGMITSFLLELLVYPAVYEIWRWDFGLKRQLERQDAATPVGVME